MTRPPTYLSYLVLGSLLLLSPGFNHISRIIVTSLELLTLTLLLFYSSSGVLQGSVLGTTHSAFIRNLLLSSLHPPQFCSLIIPPSTLSFPTIQSSLQHWINLANLWLERSRLRINAAKTKSVLIHSSRKVVDGNLTLKVDDRTAEYVWSFKFLGVVVNSLGSIIK